MARSVFGSVAGRAAAVAVALTIACGGLAFADVTGPSDPTTPPDTSTVTPTPTPPVSPDGHPWID